MPIGHARLTARRAERPMALVPMYVRMTRRIEADGVTLENGAVYEAGSELVMNPKRWYAAEARHFALVGELEVKLDPETFDVLLWRPL